MIQKLAFAAVVSAFALQAHAVTVVLPTDLGTLTTDADVVAASNSFSTNGAFSDTYSFTVAAQGGGDLFGNALYFGSGSKYNILNFKAEVFSGNLSLGLLPVGLTANKLGTVLAGDYSVVVSGTTFGASSSRHPSYDFSLTLDPAAAVQAVPEPESYAMFLAGLGLMGAIARRRTAKH
jgi:hypothetical protein